MEELKKEVAAAKPDCRGAAALFTLGARAHDLYVLGYRETDDRRPGEDWRTGPFLDPTAE